MFLFLDKEHPTLHYVHLAVIWTSTILEYRIRQGASPALLTKQKQPRDEEAGQVLSAGLGNKTLLLQSSDTSPQAPRMPPCMLVSSA